MGSACYKTKAEHTFLPGRTSSSFLLHTLKLTKAMAERNNGEDEISNHGSDQISESGYSKKSKEGGKDRTSDDRRKDRSQTVADGQTPEGDEKSPNPKRLVAVRTSSPGKIARIQGDSKKERRHYTMKEKNSDEVAKGIPLNIEKHPLYEFKRGELLGKGPNGSVYQGLGQLTGQIYAVKMIKLHGTLDEQMRNYQNVLAYFKKLVKLKHVHIGKYHHVTLDPESSTLQIVSEYVSGGTITELRKKFEKFDEFLVSKYVNEILQGLKYLHENGIIHGYYSSYKW